MTADMSVVQLLIHASIPVQIVMLILLLASIVSWSIIFTKRRLMNKTRAASDEFEAAFWSGGDLNTLYQSTTRTKGGAIGMASIFEAGFREYNRQISQEDTSPERVSDECQRAMRVAQMREVDRLEQSLATLATIGSTSPYVGLFGTVWGIMNTFHAIGATGSTSIVTVAPGIAEALVNTAAGLLAAIPAVIAYNHLLAHVRQLRRKMDDFALEFLNLVERNFT